tara:strand:+ start:631 stop:933 length:303 start_codon:yes stop_codon:yes gene_type:complete
MNLEQPKDSPWDKILYLFLPGLIGWIAGYCLLVLDAKLWLTSAVLLAATPFFIGLLNRIDKKSYFEENFKNSGFVKKIVWAWNAGTLLLLLSFVGGDHAQ